MPDIHCNMIKRLRSIKKANLTFYILVIVLMGGLTGCGWLLIRADQQLRAELLDQAQKLFQSIDSVSVNALTGTPADLGAPVYQNIQQQFAGTVAAHPEYRFVYLLGRQPDGTVFYLTASEPVGSPDYAAPGQIRTEIAAEIARVFDTRIASVNGPSIDNRGVWVSALLPIIDPLSGTVSAVAGFDMAFGDWAWKLAAGVALPVGVFLVLLIGAAAALAVTRKINSSYKSILTQLLLPLGGMLLVLLVGLMLLFWRQQQRLLDTKIESNISQVHLVLSSTQEQQLRSLSLLQTLITSNSNLQIALSQRDSGRLLADWRATFESMQTEHQITSFSFLDENLVTVLRLDAPDKFGDRLENFTALQAKRSGKAASGLELGPAGTLSLQAVQPVFLDGRLAGYVELSKQFNDLLLAENTLSGMPLAVVIHKNILNQAQWEANLPFLKRQSDWERFPNSVVIFSSEGWPSVAFNVLGQQISAAQTQGNPGAEISSAGKAWWLASAALQDASGKDIGDLLFLIDITSDQAAFTQRMAMAQAIIPVLLALVLGITFVLLYRTDKLVTLQKAKLRDGENQFHSMFLNHSATMLLIEPGSGQILDANHAAAQFYGYPVEQLKSMSINEINIQDPKDLALERGRALAGQKNYFQFRHKLACGDIRNVEVYSTAIDYDGKLVLFSILHDTTDRTQVEKALKTEKEALAKLLLVSEEFLADSESIINYQKITDDILQISGGKYAVFNLFDENGLDFQTVAVAGLSRHFRRATALLGFDLYGKKWPRDEIWAVKTRGQTITRFPSLLDLSGSVIPQATMALVNRIFHPGETVVAKILANGNLLGDFTILMYSGEPFQADNLVSIYIHQVGLLLLRKQAEAALRASQQMYRQLVEQVPEVMYTDQIGGSWQYLGPNIQALCGYSPEELIADQELWQSLIPDEDLKLLRAKIRALKLGDVLNCEYRIQTREHGLIWIGDRGVVNADNGSGNLLINGLLGDISERKRIEADLIESETSFRSLFDDSPISLWDQGFFGCQTAPGQFTRGGCAGFQGLSSRSPRSGGRMFETDTGG